jgi:NADPH:quinone reductase-like Zn-dependent oxidoreductase
MCEEAFELLADPAIRLEIAASLPLTAAADAHRMLEARSTQGCIVLHP